MCSDLLISSLILVSGYQALTHLRSLTYYTHSSCLPSKDHLVPTASHDASTHQSLAGSSPGCGCALTFSHLECLHPPSDSHCVLSAVLSVLLPQNLGLEELLLYLGFINGETESGALSRTRRQGRGGVRVRTVPLTTSTSPTQPLVFGSLDQCEGSSGVYSCRSKRLGA